MSSSRTRRSSCRDLSLTSAASAARTRLGHTLTEVVFGGATSHGVTAVVQWQDWLGRAEDDAKLPLYKQGRRRSYQDLAEEAGDSLSAQLQPAVLEERGRMIQGALDRLRRDIEAARLDVLVVIGDDQGEAFPPSSTPTLAIHTGEQATAAQMPVPDDAAPWMHRAVAGLGMDRSRPLPTAGELAVQVIGSLARQGFDVAPFNTDVTGRGLGHAFTFPHRRLLLDGPVRLLPILINTYYAPNQPTPARCYAIGAALCQALKTAGTSDRVGILASGGLSHFIVEEDLDRSVLEAIARSDRHILERLPAERLLEGSSEIRNWIAAAGVFAQHPVKWCEYVPTRRSPAGSGCGNGFLTWQV